ncbi:hypothetical protein [Micromonospora globbae]|uniref:hypothetical protein n=1 Tax=Micromonospora globbae TaxID=1894969 RepID=UPI0013158FED|nr:hypothetical protein [Micromonospora globbae]
MHNDEITRPGRRATARGNTPLSNSAQIPGWSRCPKPPPGTTRTSADRSDHP